LEELHLKTISDIRLALKGLTKNELVLLILTASLFLTVYVEVAVILLLPVYLLVTRQAFILFRRKADVIFLSIFWLLSMIVTIVQGGSWQDIMIGIFMVFAIIAMIFITYTMTQRIFRVILSFTCLMSIFCFAVALIQKELGMRWVWGERYSSVFSNPNYYAFYISLVVLFCIYNISKSRRWQSKLLYLLLIPMNLVALYLTECRTTFVVLLLACPVLLAFFHHKRWLALYLALLAVGCTLLIAFRGKIPLLPRMDQIGEDFVKRLDIWKGALHSIQDAPFFGRGYNSYVRIHQQYGSFTADHSHNLILELFMDFGIVGAMVLFAYFFINIGKIIRLHRQNQCHTRYALTIAVLVCVFLHGLLDITMLWPQTALLLMYVLGFSTDYDKVFIFSPDRGHPIILIHSFKKEAKQKK
jgi:O-antigen ligase